MPSPHSSRCVMPLLALTLLLLTGCAQTPSAEPPLIARSPRLAPLPQAVLRIDLKPSTRTLSEGRAWLQDSGPTLNGAMPK